MSRTSHLADLLDLLELQSTEDPTLVLLPNARAARELRSAFDLRQQSRGALAWEPASALSWAQWTNGLWSEIVVSGAESRLLLNAAQEHSLWSEIIAADATTSPLASPDALAHLARGAWQLAASYRATERLTGAAATYDNRIFAGWAEAFVQRCSTRSYLSVALLEDVLREHLQKRTLAAPRLLHLAGFGDLTPAQESLLSALRGRGTEVVHHHLTAGTTTLRACGAAPTERDELILAARWIRGFLEERAAQSRSGRVAVLLPNLDQDRDELEAVFRETLAPELQSIATDLSSKPWEIAGGPSLASLPMIAAALDLARWAESPLPLEGVSSLLLSRYLGDTASFRGNPSTESKHPAQSESTVQHEDTAQREAIVQFDSRILRHTKALRPEIALNSLVGLLDSPQARALSPGPQPPLLWPRRLHSFLQESGDLKRPRSFADWTEFLRELLRKVNWPGILDNVGAPGQAEAFSGTSAPTLTVAELAATELWDSTLDLVATLDFSGRRVPFSTALVALEREAQRAIFAPPSTRASVQVMSVADSAGSICDATVFLRATDSNWSPPERANPLLPWPLQRSLQMPGADPTLTTERARKFTADLLARSGSILFTFAREDIDGQLRASPLLAEAGLTAEELSDLVHVLPPVAPLAVETGEDDSVLAPLPFSQVSGGARVLKLQAACGFLAFAELRLRATEPDRVDIGLDAGESGTLLHRGLQCFWSQVKTQAALRAMPPLERTELLARCIDDAMPRTARPASPWDAAYLGLQKDRQLSILQRWLDEELRRGPFTVLGLEEEQLITLGPLTLRVRMDRVDRVNEGVFFVDYKTGSTADPRQWESSRPDDPQLPLYALFPEPGEIKGLAFARIRAGRDMRWLGYQSEPGILPAIRGKQLVAELSERIAAWRSTLGQLAEDFHNGRAGVRPKSYAVNCAHCAQRLLCRLDPATLLEIASDDPATAASEGHEAEESIDG